MSSLVTRCPACSTLFKVVPDQLRISEGWVRCGQCDEVFDANAHMQPPLPLQRAEDPIAHEVPLQRDVQVPAGPVDVVPEREWPASPLLEQSSPVEPPNADDSVVPGNVQLGESPHGDHDQPLAIAVQDVGGHALANDGGAWQRSAPSFMQGGGGNAVATRSSRWMQVLSGVLMLLLAAQWLLHARDELVAMQPALTPALDKGCEWLGCRIEPLRRIESLVIDSSSFVKVKSNIYRLSFVVRNTAAWPLAVPSAELVLTDLHDQAIVRRVLQPTEFAVPASIVPAGGELSVMVPFAAKTSAELGDKISGYRLLVFYP